MKPKNSLPRLFLLCLVLLQLGIFKINAQTIVNPSFETPTVVCRTNPTGTGIGWTFSGDSGEATNTSKYNGPAQPPPPKGVQFAFIDSSTGNAGYIYQTISNFPAGIYTFTFYAMQGWTNTPNQSINLLLDGANIGTYTPLTYTNWTYYSTGPLTLSAGNHTLMFTNNGTVGAVAFDYVQIFTPTVDSNSLSVNGILDVTGNISYGTTATNLNAVLLSYSDSNPVVGFVATQPGSFLWQDAAITNSRNKLLLDSSNNMSFYGTNGNVGIFINPNTGGGITLSNSSSKITFSDSSTLSTATNLNGAGLGLWNVSTSGSFNALVISASSLELTNATASGSNSVAIGSGAIASGAAATAFGVGDAASGSSASAYGYYTKAASFASVVFGEYNVGFVNTGGSNSWVSNDPVMEIGNGSSTNSPSDAVTIFKTGELRTAGLIQTMRGFRAPPMGDIGMGTWTSGTNPSSLLPTNGLRYSNGQ